MLGKALPACFLVGIFCTPIKSPHLESPFPSITRNSDCTQIHPMSLPRPIDSTQSCAILAQRLMQIGCIIAYSLLRPITSDNHIASIMESMRVSTSPSIIGDRLGSSCHHIYYALRCTLAQPRLLSMAQGRAWHRVVRNLFFAGDATPVPLYPTGPTRARPNAETPLPIKTPFFDYTPDYATPCSYAMSYAQLFDNTE